ncbi:annexin A2-like isoform X1 [Hoplias malabaricus]|uniref:annexin A2-like isoform X1 n=2 Tax=Hoplias malabaricus TaxID=27720 RepID=UPI0034622ACC
MKRSENCGHYREMEVSVDNVEYNPGKETMWWGTLGTVRPFQPFAPDQDARLIYDALDGKSVDVMTLVRILTNRTNAQRQSIAVPYNNLAQKDLSAVLKKALSGSFQELLLALMMTPVQFDAHRLRQSMEGLGTDEDTLLEVLCTRSPTQLRDITVAYKEAYGRYLENDLISETSKDFTKLVLAILKKEELNTPGEIDYQLIDQDVQSLKDAISGKKPDSAPWIQVLTSRNSDHLNRVICRLEDVKGEPIDKIIQANFSGDIRLGLRTLVRSIQNTPLYLAQRLQACLKLSEASSWAEVKRTSCGLGSSFSDSPTIHSTPPYRKSLKGTCNWLCWACADRRTEKDSKNNFK